MILPLTAAARWKGDILLVDDTPGNLRLLSSLLTEQGYKVRVALNGAMALMAVQASPPDLILLDITMPEMDGYQVCRRLKDSPKTDEIPVIFVSALDEVLDKVKAFRVGGIDYITKPFQVEEVLARVENQLTIRRLQKQLQAQNELLRQEQEKSDRLLLNILPQPIAAQLKQEQGPLAEQFPEVTILFADIVGFTQIAAKISPPEIVGLLNQIFSVFDQLSEQHGLEKIKTIGDAYMVVGGLPHPRPDHAEAVANMALDMQQAIAQIRSINQEAIQLRIGINTGPVVAGVIGTKKFSYDLWGDTVNTASRMESAGSPGQIQVTDTTYHYLNCNYEFEERGTIPIKGKGDMKTFWLKGRKLI